MIKIVRKFFFRKKRKLKPQIFIDFPRVHDWTNKNKKNLKKKSSPISENIRNVFLSQLLFQPIKLLFLLNFLPLFLLFSSQDCFISDSTHYQYCKVIDWLISSDYSYKMGGWSCKSGFFESQRNHHWRWNWKRNSNFIFSLERTYNVIFAISISRKPFSNGIVSLWLSKRGNWLVWRLAIAKTGKKKRRTQAKTMKMFWNCVKALGMRQGFEMRKHREI